MSRGPPLGLSSFVSALATAQMSPATTSCSTGRRMLPPTSCCSTWSRSATRASSAGSPAAPSLTKPIARGQVRAVDPRHPARSPGARPSPALPAAAVDQMFRQSGVIQVETLSEMFDVAQVLTFQPLPSAVDGSRCSATATRSVPAGRGRGRRASGCTVDERDRRSAPTPPPRTSRTRSTRRSTTTHVDAVVAVYIPPLDAAGEEVAQRARRGRRAVRQAAGLDASSAAEGVPELLRVPDLAGRTAGTRVGAVLPGRRRRPCAHWPGSVEYAAWRQPARRAPCRVVRRHRPATARSARSTGSSIDAPDGRELDRRASWRELLGALRHRAVGRGSAVTTPTRRSRPASGSAGTSCSRRPPSSCASDPTWRTSGATSTPRRRCATPGTTLAGIIDRLRTRPSFVVQRDGRAGRPRRGRRARGPPVRPGRCPSASPARSPTSLGDRVLPDPADARALDAAETVRDDQGGAAAVRLPRQRAGGRRPRWRT